MTDDAFKFIARISCADHESREFKDKIRCYEAFVVGMIRGALINLGYEQVPLVQTTVKDARMQLTITVLSQ